MRKGLFILAAALLVAQPAAAVYQTGDIVDEFTLPDPTGQPHSLYPLLATATVVLFWATW